ncbi:MAG: kynureninase [Ardenticatenia bacterium]|nr:kynureninase [Ardenticatenia bacterium]
MSPVTRAELEALDARDPLAPFRERFDLPDGVIYLDGNSLGALPRPTAKRVQELVTREWGQDLIRSWNVHGWIDLPRRVGAKIARLIGAAPDEVVVCDSTSINLFKVLAAALRLRPERRVILSDTGNFPTDLYMAQGLVELLGQQHEVRIVDERDVLNAIDDQVAVVMLTQVNYRTGYLHDMAAITRRAHERGALVIWDLAHSAGALPVDLNGCGVDFAVGCGYKYLNGGPGAPAFLFVAKKWQAHVRSPLWGWLGHAEPFAFELTYRPADGIGRFLCGTPPVLSMAALEVGVDFLLEADIEAVRHKSQLLGHHFIALADQELVPFGFEVTSPRDPNRRGSQVSLRHPEGYPMVQALISRGIIGDFRAPDILRFGLAPLYVRYVDVWETVMALREIVETRAWDRPEFRRRAKVT